MSRRELYLILYAVISPPTLTFLYLLLRDHFAFAVLPLVELAIQIAILISGAICAYLGLPGRRSFRSGMSFVYLFCATAVTVFVEFSFECSRGNCL